LTASTGRGWMGGWGAASLATTHVSSRQLTDTGQNTSLPPSARVKVVVAVGGGM
jgi:hypothetical protein